MRKGLSLVLTVLLCFAGFAVAAEELLSPFEIPPNGKPDMLVAGIDFEAPSALAFDSRNRPYMFHTREPESFGDILTLRHGKWIRLSYVEALRNKFPDLQPPSRRFSHALGTVAIDDEDAIYAVVAIPKSQQEFVWVLLYSYDLGGHFDVYELPGPSFLEIPTGHNNTSRPPVVGSIVLWKTHAAKWTDHHNLLVFLPRREGKRLIMGAPLTVSMECSGISNHSGGYSFAVTTDSKCHVVYVEIPPDNKGNPTYAATIDRTTGRVSARQLLVNAPPKVPDVHATPVIAADSSGYLHVLSGAHNQSFYYLRSTKPDTIEGGWTKPQIQGRTQTYASLICDSQNRLHSVYRAASTLQYQHKSPGADSWSEQEKLVMAPNGHRGYTIFYHRLFIDRADALYLSFTFFNLYAREGGQYPRALAVSEDNGKSWRLATTAKMQSRVAPASRDE